MFQRLSSGGHTRSHPEHGSQAPDRRWYLVLGSGRVGRRWIHAPFTVNSGRGFFVLHGPLAPMRCRDSFVALALAAHGSCRSSCSLRDSREGDKLHWILRIRSGCRRRARGQMADRVRHDVSTSVHGSHRPYLTAHRPRLIAHYSKLCQLAAAPPLSIFYIHDK